MAGVGMFTTGYVVVWLGFSAAATGLQWLLGKILPHDDLPGRIAGGLLVLPGLYMIAQA